MYIVTDTMNGKTNIACPYTTLALAREGVNDILMGTSHWTKDPDHSHTWHYVFETGAGTVQIFECEVDQTTDLFWACKSVK